MTRSFDCVLLVQLGSPENATPLAVKDYLISFLGDPHTLGNPPPFWNLSLKHLIAPIRAASSAKKYKEMIESFIYDEMPLDYYTRRFALGVAEKCREQFPVFYAYQHGCRPSVRDAFTEINRQGLQRLLMIPMYPQYSSATSGAAIALVEKTSKEFPEIRVSVKDSFGSKDFWFSNVARKIKESWNAPTHVIISWHGVQKKRIRLGDPYQKECEQSAALIQNLLGNNCPVIQSYQSRFGFVEWLKPSTQEILNQLAQKKARVLIACPSFTVDNLETLYEIDIELQKEFKNLGGESFTRVPCLNDDPKWIKDFSSELLFGI